MIFVEFGYRGFERQFTAGNLSFWTRSEVRVAGRRQPFSINARPIAAARWVYPTRWTKEDEVGAFFEPAITRTQRRHPGAGDHWHCIEGEAVESLARWQAGFAQMPFDPASVPFAIMLSERRKQAGPEPTFLVCPRGKSVDQFVTSAGAVGWGWGSKTLGVDGRCVPENRAAFSRQSRHR